MTVQLVALTWETNDPQLLARFWAEALRWDVGDTNDDAVVLAPTDDTGFRIAFRRVVTPKLGQNRQHLDLTTTSIDDQNETVARLIELGGRHVDIGQGPEDTHVVLADPDGNELCVIEPTNNFLAGCPRIGAVNCDGTADVGHFWSEALGWPLVWDQDEETAIRSPDRTGPMITWSGPPLMPMLGRDRLHFEIVPVGDASRESEGDRLVGLGASLVGADDERVVMTDPDGNEFCLSTPR